MLAQLDQLYADSLAQLNQAESTAELETWYKAALGRKGSVYLMTRQVGQLSAEERPAFGKRINAVKQELETAYEQRLAELRSAELDALMASSAIDVTLPGRKQWHGRLHPATQTLREIYRIWGDMGFQVYRSRDVETDEYNFELLNIPQDHPARDMWDTFHTTTPGMILRTHTSPGQIHAMRDLGENGTQPIRVILPGMCYRYEQVTARSEMQFHQLEGLAIGRNIHMSDLKGTVTAFARRMFGAEAAVRFRASYFPFTEPSMEIDVECFLCGGEGCR
ncbi:MAG: phenylalanine--tRNA ligase subunit alpha, partial [Anaerolineales bacterium]|nr:phenylalanine--tRNA ligase subunit alpha [Anaerolineales bacterium]